MQNLILNSMQPDVQSDDGREPEHSGGSPQGSLGSAQGSLWLRWLRPTTAFGAHRARLRPGLLLKMFFGPMRPPIKMGASFMFARVEKSYLTQSTSMSAAGCACVV